MYEISLVVKGPNWQNFLWQYFHTEPSQVIINGVSQNSDVKKGFTFVEELNNVTLIFSNRIDNCKQMFFELPNILEANIN